MARYDSDEKMKSAYMPKIKRFTDERLTPENAKQIYQFLQPYHYDTGGRHLYEAAKGILQTDIDLEFSIEDAKLLELLDDYGRLKWLELAKFAETQPKQLPPGYERQTAYTLNESLPEYQEYQNKLWVAVIRSITINLCNIQPYLLEGFWNRLSYI
jgi:hypothetical protein